ncbi:MAG: DUF2855 family protein [Pseudomonadota bacterium]
MPVTNASNQEFIVERENLRNCKFVATPLPDAGSMADGQVLLKIDKFAFTSNNVTYAAFGQAMSYWNFFPAPEGWGKIPVWGFAEVVLSKHESIQAGERFYGYYPMSSHVVLQPTRCSEHGFSDGAGHRQAMHALYNQYLRTSTDPAYSAGSEDQQVLLRPLFITSFMIDDFLADNDFFGARTVLLSSASSKTAYGTAFMLSQRGKDQCEVIGLTSAANAAFVTGLGCYDRVVTYDQVASLPGDVPVVYVDMAGNGQLRSSLHHHYQDNMKYSCAVGGTHWDELGGAGNLPGARPALFFAPAQIKKRMGDWGPGGLQQKLAQAWQQFMQPVMDKDKPWMQVQQGQGPADVQQVYLQMLDGGTQPNEGHVLTLAGQ